MTPDQSKMLREVHECLLGNKNTDNPGLIKRVNKLEAYQKKDQQRWWKITGGVVLGIPVAGFIAEWAKHKIFDL